MEQYQRILVDFENDPRLVNQSNSTLRNKFCCASRHIRIAKAVLRERVAQAERDAENKRWADDLRRKLRMETLSDAQIERYIIEAAMKSADRRINMARR